VAAVRPLSDSDPSWRSGAAVADFDVAVILNLIIRAGQVVPTGNLRSHSTRILRASRFRSPMKSEFIEERHNDLAAVEVSNTSTQDQQGLQPVHGVPDESFLARLGHLGKEPGNFLVAYLLALTPSNLMEVCTQRLIRNGFQSELHAAPFELRV